MLESDSGESLVFGQKATNEVAPGATISGGPIPVSTPRFQFRCVILQLLFPVSMTSQ